MLLCGRRPENIALLSHDSPRSPPVSRERLLTFPPNFAQLNTSEKTAKALGGGIEKLVEAYPDTLKSVPKVLMILYQADVLDEDAIRHFATHVSKKYVSKDLSKKVRKAADPILQWLDEASSDEDDDEDESE